MTLLDALLLLLLLFAGFRGYKIGFSRQGPTAVFAIAGLYLGARLAGLTQDVSFDPFIKTTLVLGSIIACAVIGMRVGEYVASKLRMKVQSPSSHLLDSIGGVLITVVTFLFAIWLATTLLVLGPPSSLQAIIRRSSISKSLNATFPPPATVFSNIDRLLSSENNPLVLIGQQASPSTDKPLPDIHLFDSILPKAQAATVKLEGFGCGGIVDGSGFIIAKNYVVTNAHVVAGVKHPKIVDSEGTHNASLVWIDIKQDLAVLRTDPLVAQPLSFADEPIQNGADVLIIGFPRGGEQVSSPGIVLEKVRALGKDIYLQDPVIRNVLSLQATVIQGNSGGPVVAENGEVVGVVFATSTAYNTIGYAVDSSSIKDSVLSATKLKKSLPTQPCSAKGF
ncbi:MAG: MarP family serine protease [Candidatus Saccharimonadales bacterium]